MVSLYERLQALASVLEQRLPAAQKSEANTSQFLVMPFFEVLGYSVHDPNDVEPEYTADLFTGGKRVDYALKKAGKPILLIEVKPASGKLERQHTKQLHAYFSSKLDVRFGVVTNGLEYRFYSDLELPNVMDDEPFLTLDMRNLNESLIADIQLFTKSGFDKDSAVQSARVAKDRGEIRSILRSEFHPLSQRALGFILNIVHPGKTDKSRSTLLRTLIEQEWQEFVGLKHAEVEAKVVVKPNDGNAKSLRPLRSGPPADPEYIPVYGYYEEHRLKAELLRTSIENGLTIVGNQIRYGGKLTWPKNAAVMAIRSIDPSFDPKSTYINGFTFWHVVDPVDGKEHMIRYISGWDQTDEALRQRVLSQ